MRVNLISMLLWWSWNFAAKLLGNCIYVICIIDASERISYDALKIVIWLFSMRLDNYEIDLLDCLFIFVDEVELVCGVLWEESRSLWFMKEMQWTSGRLGEH